MKRNHVLHKIKLILTRAVQFRIPGFVCLTPYAHILKIIVRPEARVARDSSRWIKGPAVKGNVPIVDSKGRTLNSLKYKICYKLWCSNVQLVDTKYTIAHQLNTLKLSFKFQFQLHKAKDFLCENNSNTSTITPLLGLNSDRNMFI